MGDATGALQVDLPDLRAFADLVDGLSSDLAQVANHVDTHCVSTEFGPLLDKLSGEYVSLLPQIKSYFDEQTSRLRTFATALDRTLTDYVITDDGVAERFGSDGITGGGGKSNRFWTQDMPLSSPTADESELPEIDFGFPFDQLAWAVDTVCGFDVRREVTDIIVGNVVEVSTQSNAWYSASSLVSTTQWNLWRANSWIGATWSGEAALESIGSSEEWVTTFENEAVDLDNVALHLKDIAADAVEVGQLVVDLILFAVDLIASAWTAQFIPIYGQVKFAKKAWEAYDKCKEAWDKISMFKDLLEIVIGYLRVLHDKFNPVELPSTASYA